MPNLMSWKIKWKDGTISFWPQSMWTAEELGKLVNITSFGLVKDKLRKAA